MSDSNTSKEWKTIIVEPERIRSGLWGYDEGDIAASYSADVFAEKKALRRPFNFAHSQYVAMSVQNGGLVRGEARAYPLVHASYADEVMNSYRQCGLRDGYTGKAIKRFGHDCILGLPIIFKQRALRKDEILDLSRRMFAYGGYFAKQAGTYHNLLQQWQRDYECPKLKKIFAAELEQKESPQTQSEMRAFIEMNAVSEIEQLVLL